MSRPPRLSGFSYTGVCRYFLTFCTFERQACFAAEKIIPGIPLARWYPELQDGLLICVTEMNEGEEIERLVRTFSGK